MNASSEPNAPTMSLPGNIDRKAAEHQTCFSRAIRSSVRNGSQTCGACSVSRDEISSSPFDRATDTPDIPSPSMERKSIQKPDFSRLKQPWHWVEKNRSWELKVPVNVNGFEGEWFIWFHERPYYCDRGRFDCNV